MDHGDEPARWPVPGDWVCAEHGIVERPHAGVVPACPVCLVGLLRVVVQRGQSVYQEVGPERCAGAERHPLVEDAVLVGWVGCPCNASGGHRSWACRRCGDVQAWPPHDVARAQPYFGPGAGDRVVGLAT